MEMEMENWVYILEISDRSYLIKHSFDIQKDLADNCGGMHLIFYRSFNDLILGVAYKFLLENLSPSSVKNIIFKMNPKGNDLRKNFPSYESKQAR